MPQLWSMVGRPAGKLSPSTGLLAIAVALGVCGRVTVYGYGGSRDADPSPYAHYWDAHGRAPRGKRRVGSGYYDPRHS